MKSRRTFLLMTLLLASVGVWFWLQWWADSYDQPYCRIEDDLYVGASVKSPPKGTKAVVNLCGRADSYTVEASLWEPILESAEEPDLDWMRRVVAFIDKQRQAQRPTYVHCMAGMNRSGAVVTGYLMFKHGWDRDRALTFVRSKRPQIQPNPTLMRLLAQWEKSLQDQR